MECKTITDEMVAKLTALLPAEALYTKNDLTMIRPIYVIERFNEVFGVGGWQTQTCPIEKDGQNVVCKTTLTVPEYNIYHESYGSCGNQDVGAAYKGAETDAINKIGSFLGIGQDVYKGITKLERPIQSKLSIPKPTEHSPKPQRYHFELESHTNKTGNHYIVLDDINQLQDENELLNFYQEFVQTCSDEKRKQMAYGKLQKRAKALSVQVHFE